jgi:hypothetical protein
VQINSSLIFTAILSPVSVFLMSADVNRHACGAQSCGNSLDGAKPDLIEQYLRKGILDRHTASVECAGTV